MTTTTCWETGFSCMSGIGVLYPAKAPVGTRRT
jgi:hypothetical protein